MLGITYDKLTHTSDHFDSLIKYCEQMIKVGKAYVDDTDPETMKKEREERAVSKNRNNSEFLFLFCIIVMNLYPESLKSPKKFL